MLRTPSRIVIVAAVVAAAAVLTTVFLTFSSSRGDNAAVSAGGGIWSRGDTWTVKVRQSGGAISPDGSGSTWDVPYRFRVSERRGDVWTVSVRQPGAEGPFADGWRLAYRARGSALVLTKVAAGTQPWLPASMAPVVLGAQFPYESRYTQAPKSQSVRAMKLMTRTQLPPSAPIPTDRRGEAATARPPVSAPRMGPGEAPMPSVGRGTAAH